MPTNVSAEYKKAKAAFQSAKDPAERLHCLKEMLRAIPKHKGTEHLQADIKTRIKQLTEELSGPRKGAARKGPSHTVSPEGAAQVALVGPPNAGKSALHSRLTGSHAQSAEYPHTTNEPLPGMLPVDDIQIQLVDLPPISADFMEPWMPNALQLAHAAMLVVDLGTPGCVENVASIRETLEDKHVLLVPDWPYDFETPDAPLPNPTDEEPEDDDLADPFLIRLPTLLVANKSDINASTEEITILEELVGVRYPAISVSAETGQGLGSMGRMLVEGLGIVRVYTKIPGHPPDADRPWTFFRGATVLDVATKVHRELAQSLKFARIWGGGKFDGQQVGRDHVVEDGDILELHG